MTVQSFFLALGQVCLKIGLKGFIWQPLDSDLIVRSLKNGYFWLAGICMIVSALLWVNVLHKCDLSVAFPLLSISFIFAFVAGVLIFHEIAPPIRWLGVVFIVLGIILITRSQS